MLAIPSITSPSYSKYVNCYRQTRWRFSFNPSRSNAGLSREEPQEHCGHDHRYPDKGQTTEKASGPVSNNSDAIRTYEPSQVSDGIDQGNSGGRCISRQKLAGQGPERTRNAVDARSHKR